MSERPRKGSGSSYWPTPDAAASTQTSRDGSNGRIGPWPTPQTADGERGSLTMMRGNPTLKGAATTWAMPQVNGNVYDLLPNQAKKWSIDEACLGLPAPKTLTDGENTSLSTPLLRRQLNPRFVEALQGWPIGWALPYPRGSTNCDSLATESSPNVPKPPFSISGIDSSSLKIVIAEALIKIAESL